MILFETFDLKKTVFRLLFKRISFTYARDEYLQHGVVCLGLLGQLHLQALFVIQLDSSSHHY